MSARTDVDRRITEAAMELLRSQGPAAVTIEAVAAHAGVARTTVYRRYTDRASMLDAVLGAYQVAAVVEPSEDIWIDLERMLQQAQHTFSSGMGTGAFMALVSHDQQAETIRRTLITARVQRLIERLDSGVESGQLRAGLDTAAAADLLLGAAAARFAALGDFPPTWAADILATIRPALAPQD